MVEEKVEEVRNETVVEEKKKKSQPKITVRKLRSSGESVLVEWLDKKERLYRGYVPVSHLVDGKVDQDRLDEAVPYGVPWELIKFNAPKPEELADALRKAGIWDEYDAAHAPNVIMGVLQRMYGIDFAAVVKFASKMS